MICFLILILIERIIELRELLGSSEGICLGTDFGGLSKRTAVLGLEDVTTFGDYLYSRMKASGKFSEKDIEGIFNKNALRFLEHALPDK